MLNTSAGKDMNTSHPRNLINESIKGDFQQQGSARKAGQDQTCVLVRECLGKDGSSGLGNANLEQRSAACVKYTVIWNTLPAHVWLDCSLVFYSMNKLEPGWHMVYQFKL